MKRRIYGMLSILLLCCVLLTGLSLTAFATGGTGDATLSGLEVSPGTLTPEFSSDVYEYQVEVGSECDKLLVNAKTTDSGAKMVIAGNDGLKAGSNTVIINVTAADGVTKAKYTITAVRGTAGSPGQTTAAPSAPSQTGESLGSSPLSGPNVGGSAPVGTSAAESQSTATQPSAGTITTEGKTYTLSEPSEDLIPSGFIAADVTIGGQTVKGWRFPDSSQADEFYLIYGTSGTGRTAFFIYDAGEGSVITAPESVLTMNQESQISQNQLKTAQSGYQKTLKMRLWIIIGLAILCFILLIALTASMTRHRHRDDFYEDDEADELYEDDRYEDERELSPRDRARRAYERGEESYSDYEEEYDDLDEEPTGGRMWASTEAHAQKAKAAEAAPAGDFADLDSLEEEFEDLDLSGEEFEEPAVSYEEPVEPDSPGEEFEDLDFSDEEFEGPAVSYEEPVEAASPEEEFPVVEIPEKFFDEARA